MPIADLQKPMGFGRYVGPHLLWMPRYAKGGEKKVNSAIIANILDVITLTFPLTRSVLLLIGLVTYPGEIRKTNQAKESFRLLAEKEQTRAETYEELVRSNA